MQFLNALIYASITLFLTTSCSSKLTKNIQAKQEVKIESIPSGSDVYIDGKFIGVTPMVVSLQSDMSHEINFKKSGFKAVSKYLNPVYRDEKKPYVQFGLAKDLGYYYQLSKDHIVAELLWDYLPNTAGIVPFEKMGKLLAKADKAVLSGELSKSEHEIVVSQIIELYNSN